MYLLVKHRVCNGNRINIFPGGLLGSDDPRSNDEVLSIEDVKAIDVTVSKERERGEVLPAVVLTVIELRMSAVPQVNIRGTFQPIIRIQGSGYNILSTDFLPQTTYRGRGPITFAIPGNIWLLFSFHSMLTIF